MASSPPVPGMTEFKSPTASLEDSILRNDAAAYNEFASAAVDLSDAHVSKDGLLTGKLHGTTTSFTSRIACYRLYYRNGQDLYITLFLSDGPLPTLTHTRALVGYFCGSDTIGARH
jgi:hypothetical protein